MALGFYNPLQRLLDGPLNVSGQPERTPEGLINRPNSGPATLQLGGPRRTDQYGREYGGQRNGQDYWQDTGESYRKMAEEAGFAGMPAVYSGMTDSRDMIGGNFTSPSGEPIGPMDPITGKPYSGGSVGLQAREKLADYFENNPGSKEWWQSNFGESPQAGFDPGGAPAPYAATVDQVTRGLDPVTQQLLFGLDGEGGFIPGAMRAAERTFFDDQGNPVVIPEQVADLTQDQLDAFQLARSGVGSEGRFLTDAEAQYRQGLAEQQNYLKDALGQYRSGVDTQGSFLGDAEAAYRSGIGSLMGGLERGLGVTEGATERFRDDLGGVEDIMRGTTRGYDPSMTEQFYNPYEDRVVQQTISDVMDAGDRADVAQTARDLMTGGESAFGSRARLNAAERREALGRGLGEALGGIRSRGFTEAQRTGLGEFGRQLASERSAASGLAGLA